MKLSNAAVASRYFLSKCTIGVQMYCVFSLSAIYCVVVLLVGVFLDGKVLWGSFGFRQISKSMASSTHRSGEMVQSLQISPCRWSADVHNHNGCDVWLLQVAVLCVLQMIVIPFLISLYIIHNFIHYCVCVCVRVYVCVCVCVCECVCVCVCVS